MVARTQLSVKLWYIVWLVHFITYYYTAYPNTGITYNAFSKKFTQHERINERLRLTVQLRVEVAETLDGF